MLIPVFSWNFLGEKGKQQLLVLKNWRGMEVWQITLFFPLSTFPFGSEYKISPANSFTSNRITKDTGTLCACKMPHLLPKQPLRSTQVGRQDLSTSFHNTVCHPLVQCHLNLSTTAWELWARPLCHMFPVYYFSSHHIPAHHNSRTTTMPLLMWTTRKLKKKRERQEKKLKLTTT